LRKLIKKAYQEFKTPICPVRKLANQLYIEQLFQGPTLAFKDYALSLLGQVCDYILKKGKLKKQIFCATSGDTGPAAIHGFKNCDNIDITVYFPDKNVSKLQRQQMMGVKKSNVHAIPMKGSFDDAQALVKKLFLVDKQDKLMAVNSINIGRIIAQMVYYIYAVLQFNNTKTCFYVPSGNFGNILAGYMAKCLGFNIELAIVVNDNDTLARFAKTGIFKPSKTIMTDASAMDIANPSNFERIL
jgi:threonine synthase